MRILLVSSAFILPLLMLSVSAGEDQWTCKMIWLFKMPCVKPVTSLLRQVSVWSTNSCDEEDNEERCNYKLVEGSPRNIEVQHLSQRTNKNTTIHFDFTPPEAQSFCRMKVFSSADDNVTTPNEYCLIYNLIEASRLTRAPGSRMICTEGMCPSLEKAPCRE